MTRFKNSVIFRRRTLVLVLVVLVGFTSGAWAADYLGSGQHSSRFLNWNYFGVTSYNGSYISRATTAMSNWTNTTDLVMTKVSGSNWDIAFVTDNYGAVSWAGLAVCYNSSGQNWLNNSSVFNQTLAYCYAYNNRYYMDSSSSSQRINLFMHESGHCYSLAHRNFTSSIMYPYVQSLTTTNSTDRSLINARY